MTFQLTGRKVLERDRKGQPMVLAKIQERMSFRPVKSDPNAVVPLSNLEVGDTFKLYWEGGTHPQGAEGVLLLVNQSRARVRLRGAAKDVHEWVDKTGKVRSMTPPNVTDTDWSPGTLVIKTGTNEDVKEAIEAKTRKGEPVKQSMSFKPADFQPESKEDTVAKTKANGKAKKAKVAAEAENKCGCGCGTMVRRTFAQGHDARFYGWAKKVVSGDLDPKDLPNATAKAQLKDKGAAKRVLAAHGA